MRLSFALRLTLAVLAACAVLSAQVAPPRVIGPPDRPETAPKPGCRIPQPQRRQGQTGTTTSGQPADNQPRSSRHSRERSPPPSRKALPPPDAPRLTDSGAFIMPNASLTEMIDLLAKRLKINYILDPAVKGTVSIFTYGEVKPVDYMPLLETILRVNGGAMVKVGDIYRIVPVNRINQLPLRRWSTRIRRPCRTTSGW